MGGPFASLNDLPIYSYSMRLQILANSLTINKVERIIRFEILEMNQSTFCAERRGFSPGTLWFPSLQGGLRLAPNHGISP